nr:reverse transcriptase domain-containing protein [Tanacetum cinerariifolium]
MLAIQSEEGEGSRHPSEPQAPSFIAQPTHEDPILIIASSLHKKTQTHKQALQKVTELPQTSEPIHNVANEAVYEEWDDRVERATTTAASLDAAHASGNILKTQSTVMPYVPFPQGTSAGGSPMCPEAMGAPFLRLGLRGYLHSPMLHLSQELTHLEGRSMIEEINQDANVTLVTPTHVSTQMEAQSQEDQPKDQLGVLSAAKVLADTAKRNVQTYTRRREVNTGSRGVSTTSRMSCTAKESVSTAGASMPVSTTGMIDKGKGIMKDSKSDVTKTKRQQEQEKLGLETAELFKATIRSIKDFVPIESEDDKAVSKLAAARSLKRDVEEELDQGRSKKQKIGESSEPRSKDIDELSQEELQQLMIKVPEQGMNKGMDIYMLVEKEYPLSRESSNNSQLMEKIEALTIKIDSQFKDIKGEIRKCEMDEIVVEDHTHRRTLSNLGASINLMPYSMYASLFRNTLKPTRMSICLANHTYQYPMGVAENILVQVENLIFSVDFVILQIEDEKVPLIIGRPFMHTAGAIIQVKNKELNLGVGDDRITFLIDKAMQHSHSNDDTCFRMDVIDDVTEEDLDALLDDSEPFFNTSEKSTNYLLIKNSKNSWLSIEKRFLQLHELDELRLQAYKNSKLYKDRTKAYHDRNLRIRKEFKARDEVLFYNSKYKFKAPKVRLKWYGPFVVKHGFPSGYVTLHDKHEGSFIVNGHRVKLYHDEEQINKLTTEQIHLMCKQGKMKAIPFMAPFSANYCETVPWVVEKPFIYNVVENTCNEAKLYDLDETGEGIVQGNFPYVKKDMGNKFILEGK